MTDARMPDISGKTLTVLSGLLAALTACSDQSNPTAPSRVATRDAPTTTAASPFAMSAEARAGLSAALASARQQYGAALGVRDAADRVAAAFDAVANRLDANDRAGAERAIAAAKRTVAQYREAGGADAQRVALELAAMELTLEQVAALTTEERSAAGDPDTHIPEHSRIQQEDRQP